MSKEKTTSTKGRRKSIKSPEKVNISASARRVISSGIFTGVPLSSQEAIIHSSTGDVSGSIIIPRNLAGKHLIIDGIEITVEDALGRIEDQETKEKADSQGRAVKAIFLGFNKDIDLNPVYSTSELAARVVEEK